MDESGCRQCGTTLVAIASTAGRHGMYPTLFLSCRHCGAAWEQNDRGRFVKRHDVLAPA
jgi:DNA-directed RNA polymerase subunit M/transcription elongation factor TFIIS